ncbi:MAG: putative metal-binding motif-containing protein, partial [Myxococcales bacterium]|nr:putative metal-binding motif-containing protein [Myxococcales bacterium]
MWWLFLNVAQAVDVCAQCTYTEVDAAIAAGHTEIVLTDARTYAPISVASDDPGPIDIVAKAAAVVQGVGEPALRVDGNHVVLTGFELVAPGASAVELRGLATVELDSMTVRDSGAADLPSGGAVSVRGPGTLIVRGGTMERNQALVGGAIASFADKAGAVVHLVDAHLEANVAEAGGAVHLTSSTLDVSGTTRFVGNQATRSGGAMALADTLLTVAVAGSTVAFEDNVVAEGRPDAVGGAMHLSAGTSAVLQDVNFRSNIAPSGGALWVDGGTKVVVSAGTFDGNTALQGPGGAGRGGAVGVGEGAALVTQAVAFVGNDALLGGHVFVSAAYADVGSSFVLGSALAGGAVHADGLVGPKQDFSVHLTASTFEANVAVVGGGVDVLGPGAVLIEGVEVLANEAEWGGFLQASGTRDVSVRASTFTGGEATSGAGGHLSIQGADQVTLNGNTFAEGEAGTDGGSVFAESVDLVRIVDSAFVSGRAAGVGGAVALRAVDDVQLVRNAYCDTVAGSFGGAVDLVDSCGVGGLPCLLTNEIVDGARAGTSGDAVSIRAGTTSLGAAEVDLDHLTVRGSRVPASLGAAIHAGPSVFLTVQATWLDLGSRRAFDVVEPVQPLAHVFTDAGAVETVPGVGTASADYLQLDVGAAVACGEDLRLHPASELVARVPEPDGSFSDVGAFGGPLVADRWLVDADGDGDLWLYDCDEGDDTVGGRQPESCINGRDDDCDGVVDEQSGPWSLRWIDADGDGFGDGATDSFQDCGPLGNRQADRGGDCDDSDPMRFPGALERCDGEDDDCDGVVDDEPAQGILGLVDRDGDGYPAPGDPVLVCEGAP